MDIRSDEWFLEMFLDYARRRNFSESLKKLCIEVLNRSCNAGDGALWSDSLLSVLLEENESRTARSLNVLMGARGGILSEISFEDTIATQDYIYNPAFQKPLDEAIQVYVRKNRGKEVDEDTVIQLELREAVESYGHYHSALTGYIHYLLEPTIEIEGKANGIKGGASALWRFQSIFVDAFILSAMAETHPFDIFLDDANSIFLSPKTPMLRFLMLLRDAAKVTPEIVPDGTLKAIVKRWDRAAFLEALGWDVNADEGFRDDDDDEKDNDLIPYYQDACYFASVQLMLQGASLAMLLEKLDWKTNPLDKTPFWNNNEALLIYWRKGQLQVAPTDLLGVQRIVVPSTSIYEVSKASCGIIIPNPIWNETVIDRLEYMINRSDIAEADLQVFFEMYPDFILDDLHFNAIPQVTLLRETSYNLRPDFVIQRTESKYIDIVELKKPVTNLISGPDTRPTMTRTLSKAIAQLKEYGEWFRSEGNKAWFRKKYSLDGYEPVLTLVIGRSIAFRNEEVRRRVLEGQGINLITYDELVKIAKVRRNRVMPRA